MPVRSGNQALSPSAMTYEAAVLELRSMLFLHAND